MSKRLPAEERRAQLLAAAISISEESGLGSLTIRSVAERAGVSLGVVHYCFVDKDELVQAVIDAVNEDLASATRAFLNLDFSSGATGPQALGDLIREALDLQWQVISSMPDRQLLTYEIVAYTLRSRSQAGTGLAHGQYHGYDSLVELVARRAAESSSMEWEDFPSVVGGMVALLDGAVLRWLIDRDAEAFKRTMDMGIDSFVSQARPAEAEASQAAGSQAEATGAEPAGA
ncbi:TetR/AcrR family transcriptional regulator [Dietzia sp.]|uniref:TetR/AcrR family transcriptional regulator n=1 Tax=Dietzia sp. TaxID=1871616 RepID=UPI002FDA843A